MHNTCNISTYIDFRFTLQLVKESCCVKNRQLIAVFFAKRSISKKILKMPKPRYGGGGGVFLECSNQDISGDFSHKIFKPRYIRGFFTYNAQSKIY